MALLQAVTAGVVIVFVVAGSYAGWRALDQEGRAASRDAAVRAAAAAHALNSAWRQMATQVASLAANPTARAGFSDPSACQLSFSVDLLPDGHLDLVSPSGRVLCSSHLLPHSGISQAGAPWLARLHSARGVLVSGPFRDAVTAERSVAVVAGVRDGNGLLGAVEAVAPLADLADGLAADFGESLGYNYAVIDDANGAVLSESAGGQAGTNPIVSGGKFYGSAAVPGLGWTVFAGISRATALGPTRELLIEEAVMAAVALLVIVILLGILQSRVAVPLAKLTEVVGDSGPHVESVLTTLEGSAEVSQLAAAFNQFRKAQTAHEAVLAHHSLHDPLTGLPNRALLADRLEQALAGTDAGSKLSVLYIDIDRFGLINESLGYAAGDQAMIAVAARLVEASPQAATVARFDGDEFVIICEQLGSAAAAALAERVATSVSEPLAVSNQVVRLAISTGITVAGPGASVERTFRDAGEAMYRAKQRGGARWEMFQPGNSKVATDRLVLETELRVAIEREELQVLYQPKVEIDTGAIVGAEALLRWVHPGLGHVPPATFIPVAEQTGMIDAIGHFVLDTACAQASRWRERGIDIPISVNLSARQLDDPTLVEQISSLIGRYRLPPDALCLELTETALMHDPDRAVAALHDLKALGVTLSVDDFGTGYSSLAYLQRFPVDEVKIDRTFTSQLVRNPAAVGLVDAVIAMAAALDLRVTAEGVETPAQAEVLSRAGCRIAQGFLYARPATAAATEAALRVGTNPNLQGPRP